MTNDPSADNMSGFTLIEMLVVLAIIGLVSLVSLPYFGSASKASPQKTAEAILHLAQISRLNAMTTATSRSIMFDVDTGVVKSELNEPGVIIPKGMKMSVLTGQNLVSADRTATILFLNDGSSTGGEVRLASDDSSARLQINWLTGIASIVAPPND